MNTSKDVFRLVERELLKFASYDNAKKVLAKYMIGSSYDRDMVEKVLVILATEFRHEIEKMSGSLPDDDIEAAAAIERKVAYKARSKKPKSGISIEDAGDIDIDEFDED